VSCKRKAGKQGGLSEARQDTEATQAAAALFIEFLEPKVIMARVNGAFLDALLLLLLLSVQTLPLVAAGDPRKYSKMLKTCSRLSGKLCI
jgi:hypothetical protein